MTATSGRYLVEEPGRERKSVRILLDLTPIAEKILDPLGLHAGFSWFILDVQKNRLRTSGQGDVDILAGRLEWANPGEFKRLLAEEVKERKDWHPTQVEFLIAVRVAQAGGIKWPPSTDWLVALEAKCAYLDPEADSISPENLKSTKASVKKVRRMRGQIKGLLESGFDRVALLDVIANPPVFGPDGQAWLTVAAVADDSRAAMAHVLKKRLPVDSPAGPYVWSIGAVVGGDEGRRGSSSVTELRPAHDNPLLSEHSRVTERRRQVEESLGMLFASLPKPMNLRVIFSDCQACGQIHLDGRACSG